MFKNIWTPSQSHAKPRAAEGPWATPALRPFPIMPSPQRSDQRISLEQTDHHMVQHVFLVCPCLSFQVHPKMVSLSWFHSCFLFLWLIMSYSWFIYIFVSWFVMVCVYLLVDLCLFSHVLSFSWLFWFPWDGRQGSTTVMLMLQTVSSPMAMSLPMPSTWTMDVWMRKHILCLCSASIDFALICQAEFNCSMTIPSKKVVLRTAVAHALTKAHIWSKVQGSPRKKVDH